MTTIEQWIQVPSPNVAQTINDVLLKHAELDQQLVFTADMSGSCRNSGEDTSQKLANLGVLRKPQGLFAETTLDQVAGCLRFEGDSKSLIPVEP